MKSRNRHNSRKRRKVTRAQRKGERITLRTFHNPLSIPNTNPDPERTSKTAREERSLRRNFKAMRKDLGLICYDVGYYDNDIWSWKYTEHVQRTLDFALLSWESYKAFYADIEGTEEWYRVEHSYRRTVAICHEEIDLHNQGRDVAMAAHHFNKTVGSGCCVNKGVFRRLYGF